MLPEEIHYGEGRQTSTFVVFKKKNASKSANIQRPYIFRAETSLFARKKRAHISTSVAEKRGHNVDDVSCKNGVNMFVLSVLFKVI